MDIFEKFKSYLGSSAQPTGLVEYLVVGLGNPGREYENTRHNAGFLAVDYIREKERFEMKKLKFQSLTGDVELEGKRVLFLKPSTYMNKSGEAVREAANFYKIPPARIIVLCDDVNLSPGRLRLRKSGSDGGQNGLKNIIYHLESDQFLRLRIGIGSKPHPEMDLADWVLSRFTPGELKQLGEVFERVYHGLKLILSDKWDDAVMLCNTNVEGIKQ